MPGTGGKSEHRERHAHIQRARHANAPRQRTHKTNADQITREVKGAEQARFRAIHPPGRNHRRKQRHIGKAREANASAGRRRAGKRGEGRAPRIISAFALH
jgi:hypothetical protein